LQAQLQSNCRCLVEGLAGLGLQLLGGATPIVSVHVGDEGDTLTAGRFLFERGYYVQSVTFPAVPYHGGVLRIQINANHTRQSIQGLVNAFAELQTVIHLPGPEHSRGRAA
jgi:glycine C-acetyltransferase